MIVSVSLPQIFSWEGIGLEELLLDLNIIKMRDTMVDFTIKKLF